MTKIEPKRISLAGQKLRQWRMAQSTPISAAMAAMQLGVGVMSIYGLETGERTAGRKVMTALVDAGICEAEDFFAAALPDQPPMRRRA